MDFSSSQTHATPDLVREANHRIANQLTLLVSMVQLQIDSLRRGPEQVTRQYAVELLRSVSARIIAIGNLHRRLAASGDVVIDLGPFLSASQHELLSSLASADRARVIENFSVGCRVSTDHASILCLVLSEIVINALKYAHPDGLPVVLALSCSHQDGNIVMDIADDGIGLPDGFDEAQHAGVGFKLIRNLTQSIGATLDLQSSPFGLRFRISLPAVPD